MHTGAAATVTVTDAGIAITGRTANYNGIGFDVSELLDLGTGPIRITVEFAGGGAQSGFAGMGGSGWEPIPAEGKTRVFERATWVQDGGGAWNIPAPYGRIITNEGPFVDFTVTGITIGGVCFTEL